MEIPSDINSEHYHDALDLIAGILGQHFEIDSHSMSLQIAHHFVASYQCFLEDFWTREKASIALESLSRDLKTLCTSYENVPKLVKDTLDARARGLDDERKDKYLETTTADIVFKFMLPKPDTDAAATALRTLHDHQDLLQTAIRVVRKDLPEGFATRNRPGKAYAVIEAAATVSRAKNRINVPKAIDEAGDFYRLLVDLFELFKISSTVQGAFKGWRKNVDGKYENADLMPI